MRHRCPFACCPRLIPDGLFACSNHWHSMPPELRRTVMVAWRKYIRGYISLDGLKAAHQDVLEELAGQPARAGV